MQNVTANKAVIRALRKLEEEGQHIDHFSVRALRDTFATRFIEQHFISNGDPECRKIAESN